MKYEVNVVISVKTSVSGQNCTKESAEQHIRKSVRSEIKSMDSFLDYKIKSVEAKPIG